MIALPTTGGMTTQIIKKVVMFRNRPANQPVPKIVDIAITDAGRVTRVLSRLENPKLFNAKFPKLPVPPFGIYLNVRSYTDRFGSKTVTHLGQDGNGSKEICLWIQETLNNLLHLPFTIDWIRFSSSSNDHTIFSILLFFLSQEFGIVNRVWQEEKYDKALDARRNSENLRLLGKLVYLP
jgi:hypothetical protein